MLMNSVTLAPPFLPAANNHGLLSLTQHRRRSIYSLGQGRVWKPCAARNLEKSKSFVRDLAVFSAESRLSCQYGKEPAQILIRWSIQHK